MICPTCKRTFDTPEQADAGQRRDGQYQREQQHGQLARAPVARRHAQRLMQQMAQRQPVRRRAPLMAVTRGFRRKLGRSLGGDAFGFAQS